MTSRATSSSSPFAKWEEHADTFVRTRDILNQLPVSEKQAEASGEKKEASAPQTFFIDFSSLKPEQIAMMEKMNLALHRIFYSHIHPCDESTPIHAINGAPSGFADLTVDQQIYFDRMLTTTANSFKKSGFSPFKVSPFVNRKLLVKKGGIGQQIYGVNHFVSGDMTRNAIAFDRTVPFAIWVRDHLHELPMPYGRYDIDLSFRDEGNEPGRLHAFFQGDVDLIGQNLPLTADVECITTLTNALVALNAPSFTVYLNHIKILQTQIREMGFKNREEAVRLVDKLDKQPAEEIAEKLRELEPDVDPKKIDQLLKICGYRGTLEDFPYADSLTGELKKYFADLTLAFSLLKASGIDPKNFQYAPGVARGLNYYTGIVYETILNDYPGYGSVMSGGRYDDLVDIFSKTPKGIAGAGGSMGISRLFDIMRREKKLPEVVKTAAQVLVLFRKPEFLEYCTTLASKLREKEITTTIFTGNTKFAKQLDFANQTGVGVVLAVMGDRAYFIRNMAKSQQTKDLTQMDVVVDRIQQILFHNKEEKIVHTRMDGTRELDLGHSRLLTLEDLCQVLYQGEKLTLNAQSRERLEQAQRFIAYAAEQGIPFPGLTTGLIEGKKIKREEAIKLSSNLILSNDTGNGKMFALDVVLGAMTLLAQGLSRGRSGISPQALETLLGMINAKILPEIPKKAGCDSAPLARLARAMQGHDVPVYYKGEKMAAKEALAQAKVTPFTPTELEGSALINGTAFSAAMLGTGFMKQVHLYENTLALMTLYLGATGGSVRSVQTKPGQAFVASALQKLTANSPLLNQDKPASVPQILGPKYQELMRLSDAVASELGTVPGSHLIYREEELPTDLPTSLTLEDQKWAILPNGNGDGESIATTADALRGLNATLAQTLFNHVKLLTQNQKGLPNKLSIKDARTHSGFGPAPESARGLVEEIRSLAGNISVTTEEGESTAFAATKKLLKQLDLLQQLSSIYLATVAQAYSWQKDVVVNCKALPAELASEKLLALLQVEFPIRGEPDYTRLYEKMGALLRSNALREAIDFPLSNKMGFDAFNAYPH